MRIIKSLIIIVLAANFILSCGNKNLTDNYSLQTSAVKNAIPNGAEITFSLKAKKKYDLDSVVFFMENKKIGTTTTPVFKTQLASATLGYKTVYANIYTAHGKTAANTLVALLHTQRPKVYGYTIINTYPRATENTFLQGIEFRGDTLIESHGNYGQSNIRKTNYMTGKVYKELPLGDEFFGEGLTQFGNDLHVLTWRKKIGFTYNLDTFKEKGKFNYGKSKEGWGLCNDGKTIYKSDGSSKIWKLDPSTLSEKGFIEVATHKRVQSNFNELEWVNGKIYANTWPRNGATDKSKLKESISIINPNTGALEGLIDLRNLRQKAKTSQSRGLDVLNGIAFKSDQGRLFVTGKNWDTLFEIEINEK